MQTRGYRSINGGSPDLSATRALRGRGGGTTSHPAPLLPSAPHPATDNAAIVSGVRNAGRGRESTGTADARGGAAPATLSRDAGGDATSPQGGSSQAATAANSPAAATTAAGFFLDRYQRQMNPNAWGPSEDAVLNARLLDRLTKTDMDALAKRLNRSFSAVESRIKKLRKAAGIRKQEPRPRAQRPPRVERRANAVWVSRGCLRCEVTFTYDRSDGVPLFLCDNCRRHSVSPMAGGEGSTGFRRAARHNT